MRDILNTIDILDIITGEKLQNVADIALIDDGNPNNYIFSKKQFNIQKDNLNTKLDDFKSAKVIYVKTDYINYFISNILTHLNKFILITHNSDHQIGFTNIDLLNSNKLIAWYGQNINIAHPKLYALPIGIANSQWKHGKINILHDIITKPPEKKIQLVYVNFSINTNKNERQNTKNILTKNNYIFTEPNLDWEMYLEQLSKYKFAICPEGNGFDCHRLWECLYLDVIPIVKNIPAFHQFSDLPILFIESWECINNNYLEKQYEIIQCKKQNGEYNMNKLNIEYWHNLIINYTNYI
jgi:hypothetical protein